MAGSLIDRPKILHGAFVEHGLSVPQLVVKFQFNPVELTRSRSVSFEPESYRSASEVGGGRDEAATDWKRRNDKELRDDHLKIKDLDEIQKRQTVTIGEERMSFDIRLDATDKLGEGDPIAGQFGVAPQLATLELMVLPKSESQRGGSVDNPPGLGGEGFSFTKKVNPPLVLFIWGRKKVLPVNINSLNVKESEFSIDLVPIRAIVSVGLTVIEGVNAAHTYSNVVTDALSAANPADVTNLVIPL